MLQAKNGGGMSRGEYTNRVPRRPILKSKGMITFVLACCYIHAKILGSLWAVWAHPQDQQTFSAFSHMAFSPFIQRRESRNIRIPAIF